MQTTFAQLNKSTGLIEIIDMETGNVVAVQRSTLPLLDKSPELLAEYVLPTGETVRAQKGIDIGALHAGRVSRGYSPITLDLICQRISEGEALTKICNGTGGFPSYATFCYWRRQHAEVSAQIEAARRDRGEHFRDMALAEAETAESQRDSIAGPQLRVDTYKWAAALDDGKFAPKQKVETTAIQPMVIQVNTGIVRGERDVQAKDDMVTAHTQGSISSAATDENNRGERPAEQVHTVSVTAE